MYKQIYRVLLIVVIFFCMCATSACRLIMPSTSLKEDAKNDFVSGNMESSLTKLEDKATSMFHEPDRIMWLLDAASTAFEAGKYDVALTHFQEAQIIIGEYDKRAVISLRDVANETQNLFTNPLAIPYNASTYDRILIKTYMALCYIALGDMKAARVEIQALRFLQDDLDAKFTKETAKTADKPKYRSESEAKVFNAVLKDNKINKNYSNKIEYRPYGNVMNPLASYLSAMSYYLESNAIEAELDLRRLSNMVDTHPIIVQDYQMIMDRLKGNTKNVSLFEPMVYVIYANGIAPSLREEKVDLVLPFVGYTGFSFPVYQKNPTTECKQLKITAGTHQYESYPMADFEKLYQTEFQQQQPKRIIRIVASTLGKEAISAAIIAGAYASDKNSDGVLIIAYILTGIYKYMFSTADTRSWELLPAQIQIARFPCPQNDTIKIEGLPSTQVIKIPSNAHSIMIYIRTINQKQVQFKQWILKQKGVSQ